MPSAGYRSTAGQKSSPKNFSVILSVKQPHLSRQVGKSNPALRDRLSLVREEFSPDKGRCSAELVWFVSTQSDREKLSFYRKKPTHVNFLGRLLALLLLDSKLNYFFEFVNDFKWLLCFFVLFCKAVHYFIDIDFNFIEWDDAIL